MHRTHAPARRLAALISPLALLALLVVAAPAARPARADTTYRPLPFTQDWSDAGLITADNSWSGVPGIVGYSGEGLATTFGQDPRTVLEDGSGTGAIVNADETNPNSLAPDGIAEFQGISNPTIALAGTTAADAPHLVLHLNTTGHQDIVVQYNVRDIDGSDRSATQPVMLQYRVGDSGDFINAPGNFAYVQDATTGPNLASRVVPVTAPLPAETNNQPRLQLRIIATNASGVDEWVGIDDISVTSALDAAPSASISIPENANVAAEINITITFSEAVTASADAVTLRCNGAPVAFGGLPVTAATQIVIDPTAPLPTGLCTLTVVAAQVLDVDGNPTAMTANVERTFNVVGSVCPADADVKKISAVQGTGATTPLAGQGVTVQAPVTALFPGLNGFFVQEEPADQDDNAATSEGLFVFAGNGGIPAGIAVGDVVRVSGTVAEFSTTSSNTMTQLTGPSTVDCGENATVAPVDLSLPVAALSDFERHEGMLVRLAQELTISEHFNFDRFGEYTLARPRDGEARLYAPTLRAEPGPAAQALAQENLLRRIIVDDGRSTQNPDPPTHPNGQPFSLENRFRSGDTVTGVTGVLAQQFGTYRVQPTAPGVYEQQNSRPTASAPIGGLLRVGSMNALNYFLTPNYPNTNPLDNKCGPEQSLECRGHDSDQPQELERQRNKLIAAIRLLNPDVLGLIEIENTTGVNPLADIVAALNAQSQATVDTYAAIDTGVIGTDAIRVGLIYKPAKVEPVGAFKWLTAAVDARFRDTKSRPVLAQTFRELSSGEKFTVAVAHLKSKGSDCNDVGDLDTGDGQGNCNITRRDAAQAMADWLAADPTGSGDPDVLILGDLNSYALEDPIDALLAGPDDNAGTAADNYTNLIAKYQGPLAYSYLFDAQVGYLDHALSSPSLTPQVTGANEPHINADEPDLLNYDTSFKGPAQDALYAPDPYRASDHDPIIVGLDLGTDQPDPDPGPGPVDPNDPDPVPDPTVLTPRLWLPMIRR